MVPVHATEAQTGCICTVTFILNLGTRGSV